MAKEIEIPEGYEAKIENNKVIFVPKESEDERIRKRLIEYFEGFRMGNAEVKWEGLNVQEVLVWLEKQKECVSNNFDDVWDEEDCEEIIAEGQKLIPRFKELLKEVCHAWYDRGAKLEKLEDASKAIEAVDRIDKYIDEHLANAHDMKDSNPDKKYYRGWDDALGKMAGILQDVYSNEKQKEQKPADEAEKFFDSAESYNQGFVAGQKKMKEDIEKGFGISEHSLDYLAGRYAGYEAAKAEQKPAEWSEEDKDLLLSTKCIIDEVWHSENTFGYSKEELEEIWNWLNVAWTRLEYPKENDEWSEEDKRALSNAIVALSMYANGEIPYLLPSQLLEDVERLKSLRPVSKESLQPHWKPSQEQMEALDEYIYAKDPNTEKYSKAVLSLRDELKELM